MDFRDINKEQLNSLSPEERKLALEILKQYAKNGSSDIFDELIYNDYEEIPVDIETFLTDDNYMGQAWKDSENKLKIYPYWMKRLKELFPTPFDTKVNNFIASGARGLGKSEICVAIMCYLLYRIMCLKNPLEYYHMKPTEKIVFAFMNIKLDLAEEIANSKFQNSIKMSPWFLKRGSITGRYQKYWEPDSKYCVDIKIGSQSDDLIGLPCYACLDGDTVILTDKGEKKIKDLVNQNIKVISYNEDTKQCELSDYCNVRETKKDIIEYEIELEDGTVIKCTPEHRFLLADGTYKEAQNLSESDDILEFIPYGYIYKITNLLNGKIYIGQHKKNCFDSSYLGSGYMLNKAIKKYGRESFECTFICFAQNKKELDKLEQFYIKKYNSTNLSVGYNIAEGGQGGDLGENIRKKISTSLKGRPKSADHKHKLSLANKGKHLSEEVKEKIRLGVKNKVISREAREHYSQAAIKRQSWKSFGSHKGKKLINNGKTFKYIDVRDVDNIPQGWKLGNFKTSGKKKNMKNYYSNIGMQKRKSATHKGSRNNMFGKGYLRQGGNNTNSYKRYFYKNKSFECRKYFVLWLKENIDSSISENLIRNWENNNLKQHSVKKLSKIISFMAWEWKKNESSQN